MLLRQHLYRAAWFIGATVCFALGAGLASHHPVAPIWMASAFVVFAAVFYRFEDSWLLAVPALLPVIGFASWTGWLTFEEFDVLVLAAAASGFAKNALRAQVESAAPSESRSTRRGRRKPRVVTLAAVLIGLFAIASIAAGARGFYSGTPAPWGWWQGYHEPLNSLRIFKSYGLALLLAPLLANAMAKRAEQAALKFSSGASIGLLGAALAVLWERAAYPGLLDFSADYRVTGLFWEMHVGGAALDGFLALTVPFAVWELLRAHTRMRMCLGALVLTLAVYACLITFSRGLYAAVLVSFALGAVLYLRQGGEGSRPRLGPLFLQTAVFAAVSVALSVLVFRAGGYRALGAVIAVFILLLMQGPLARRTTGAQRTIALIVGAVLAASGWGIAAILAKGPYLVFALAFVAAVAFSIGSRDGYAKRVMALGSYVWASAAAVLLAWNWGGSQAGMDAGYAVVALTALALWNAGAREPLWSDRPRMLAATLGAAVLVATVVAVFSAGAYMGGRVASSEHDFQGRIGHWRTGLDLLSGSDWILGKGLGRFPASYFYSVPDGAYPGSYSIAGDGGGSALLSLGGPRHALGFGELFRFAQRISLAGAGTYSVTLDARADEPATLHLEICEKNLLYAVGCAARAVEVKESRDWQRLAVELDGGTLTGGPWYAPRLAFFSMAVHSKGRLIYVDNIDVRGPEGWSLLSNGDFSAGMAHWFFTSDKYHLPWHIKNLFFDLLFDQGTVGLLAFVLLVGVALGRVTLGRASGQPFAPFVAASITGFLAVGAFDSLLDVPRVALLFYVIVLIAILAPGVPRGRSELRAAKQPSRAISGRRIGRSEGLA